MHIKTLFTAHRTPHPHPQKHSMGFTKAIKEALSGAGAFVDVREAAALWRLFAAGTQIVRVKQSLLAAHVHGGVRVHQ